jgi:hypothetical protein
MLLVLLWRKEQQQRRNGHDFFKQRRFFCVDSSQNSDVINNYDVINLFLIKRPGSGKRQACARHLFLAYNSTQVIPENDSKMRRYKVAIKKRHKFTNTATMVRGARKMRMDFGDTTGSQPKKPRRGDGNTSNEKSVAIQPPPVVETVVSSSQSMTSSIGIGEFAMNQARKGSQSTFASAVREHLFPKIKFLKGTNASLDFSNDATSICGFLRICCGVSEADAYQWWDHHRLSLKNIHTDFRNNKIKMIKLQFCGKLQ